MAPEFIRLAHVVSSALMFGVGVIQPTTGYLLMLQLEYPLKSMWFYAVALFYIVAGMCWVYLVKTEIRLRELAAVQGTSAALPRL